MRLDNKSISISTIASNIVGVLQLMLFFFDGFENRLVLDLVVPPTGLEVQRMIFFTA